MDKPTENAHSRLDRRSELGLQTYNVDLDRDDLTLSQWAEHLADEISDAAKYVEKVVIEARKMEARLAEPHPVNGCKHPQGFSLLAVGYGGEGGWVEPVTTTVYCKTCGEEWVFARYDALNRQEEGRRG